MLHDSRVFRVTWMGPIGPSSALELARQLTEHTLTLCTGFRLGPLVLVNDSLSPDGAQEYAVFSARDNFQLESLTVNRIEADELAWMLLRLADERSPSGMGPVCAWDSHHRLRPKQYEHGESCPHCA